MLLALFAPGRICEPLLSERCRLHAWNSIGDTVWLLNLGDWQTLLAGLLALIAAAVTAYLLNKQIQQTETHERERWRRSKEAAPAMLPLTLASLGEYVRLCAVSLKQRLAHVRAELAGEDVSAFVLTDFPDVPVSVSAALHGMILASEADDARAYVTLLNKLQVFSSRIQNADGRRSAVTMVLPTNIESNILDAAELRVLCDALFPYARGQTDTPHSPSIDLSKITNALFNLGFQDTDDTSLFSYAALTYRQQEAAI